LASGAFPSFDSFVEQGITYGYVCISLELLEISVILQEQRNLMCLLVWQQNRFISIIFDDTQFVALGEMLNGNDGFGHYFSYSNLNCLLKYYKLLRGF
jgi:hypothetical protein